MGVVRRKGRDVETSNREKKREAEMSVELSAYLMIATEDKKAHKGLGCLRDDA